MVFAADVLKGRIGVQFSSKWRDVSLDYLVNVHGNTAEDLGAVKLEPPFLMLRRKKRFRVIEERREIRNGSIGREKPNAGACKRSIQPRFETRCVFAIVNGVIAVLAGTPNDRAGELWRGESVAKLHAQINRRNLWRNTPGMSGLAPIRRNAGPGCAHREVTNLDRRFRSQHTKKKAGVIGVFPTRPSFVPAAVPRLRGSCVEKI